MENVALIFAGGVGTRMNSKSVPKQFLQINGKPIIIHTLKVFENHPGISSICVACVEPYIEHVQKLCKDFAITKLKWLVPGGTTGQESIFNGLKAINSNCTKDAVVLIHDGVRPIIDEDLITANIDSVYKHGSAISCSLSTETQAQIDSANEIVTIFPRKTSVIAKAPQSFYVKDILTAHERAIVENRSDFIDSASLMMHYGTSLFSVPCSADNIKITTPSDFYLLRAILDAKENSQIFGM